MSVGFIYVPLVIDHVTCLHRGFGRQVDAAHIQLAGDYIGNQSDMVFTDQIDFALGAGDCLVNLRRLFLDMLKNFPLLFDWWQTNWIIFYKIRWNPLLARSAGHVLLAQQQELLGRGKKPQKDPINCLRRAKNDQLDCAKAEISFKPFEVSSLAVLKTGGDLRDNHIPAPKVSEAIPNFGQKAFFGAIDISIYGDVIHWKKDNLFFIRQIRSCFRL